MSDRIIIVDRSDTPIALRTRSEICYEDIYRVSALWLTDKTSGDVLLQQRKWTKKNDPGTWQSAVAGTVEEGETYEENITKETEEEIGLRDVIFTEGPKEYVDDGAHRFFCQWFLARIDKETTPLVVQKEEVEAIKWISITDLIADLKNHPEHYPPSTAAGLKVLGILT